MDFLKGKRRTKTKYSQNHYVKFPLLPYLKKGIGLSPSFDGIVLPSLLAAEKVSVFTLDKDMIGAGCK